jgi:hypothetical protein
VHRNKKSIDIFAYLTLHMKKHGFNDYVTMAVRYAALPDM